MAHRNNKDTLFKTMFSRNEYFCDLVNAACFQGKQVLHPDSIQEADPGIPTMDDGMLIQDVVRRYYDGTDYCIIAIENQSQKDYSMVARIMAYESNGYLKEFEANQRHADKLHGRINIVLYSGKGMWNHPTSIKELVRVPEGFESLISNYEIHVISMEYFDQSFTKEMLQTEDLQTLFRGVQLMYQKKEEEFFKEFKDKEVNDTIIRLTGAILGVEEMTKKKGKESANMCELWEEVKIRELNKGIEIGEQQGYQKAKKEYDDILSKSKEEFSNKEHQRILKLYEKGLSKEEIIKIGFAEEDVLDLLKS